MKDGLGPLHPVPLKKECYRNGNTCVETDTAQGLFSATESSSGDLPLNRKGRRVSKKQYPDDLEPRSVYFASTICNEVSQLFLPT